jgi:beta-lactamase class A
MTGDWSATRKRAHESAHQDEGIEDRASTPYLHPKEGDQSNAAFCYSRAGKPVYGRRFIDTPNIVANENSPSRRWSVDWRAISPILATTLLLVWTILSSTTLAESGLERQIATIAMDAHARVGVACSLPDVPLTCDLNSTARLPMQSVYKLPIAMATLDAVERGRFSLMSSVRFIPSDLISSGQYSPLRDAHPHANADVQMKELLRLAVSESDGVASDILMRTLGGPSSVDRYIHSLGINGIRIHDTERVLGRDVRAQYRNYAEPAAMVLLLRRLADRSPLTPDHTALLLGWMTNSGTSANRIKGMLPAGTPVAHKTGTSGQDDGVTHATNDVGLITLPDGRRLAVAVFITDSPESESVREGVIARITLEIWQAALRSRRP